MNNYANHSESVLVVNDVAACDLVIIWLHGLGADGSDFAGLPDSLLICNKLKIKFIFPNAPVMPVTINGGAKMRAWYDIKNFDFNSEPDIIGVEKSATVLRQFIDHELQQGFKAQQIIIGGFSQGGAIALYLGTRLNHILGGVIALSTYLINPDQLISEYAPITCNTPIFLGHGIFDAVVPLHLARTSLDKLQQLKYQINWHTYPLVHTVSVDELEHVNSFIETNYHKIAL